MKPPDFVERLLRDTSAFGCDNNCKTNIYGCSGDGIGCGCRCDCQCHEADTALAFLKAVWSEVQYRPDLQRQLHAWAEADEEDEIAEAIAAERARVLRRHQAPP